MITKCRIARSNSVACPFVGMMAIPYPANGWYHDSGTHGNKNTRVLPVRYHYPQAMYIDVLVLPSTTVREFTRETLLIDHG